MSVEESFLAAVNIIKNLPKDGPFQPSNGLMLRFYAYYKQATEGPNTCSKPPFWDVVRKVKWEAWKKLGNMSRESAMVNYTEEFKKVAEKLSYTYNNTKMSNDELGEFYANLPEKDLNLLIGPVLERVRSQPGSPLCTSPITSRETSPDRGNNSIVSSKAVFHDEGVELDNKEKHFDSLLESPMISSISSDENVSLLQKSKENETATTAATSEEISSRVLEKIDIAVDHIKKVNDHCCYNSDQINTNGHSFPLIKQNIAENSRQNYHECMEISSSINKNIICCDECRVITHTILRLHQDVEAIFKKLCTLEGQLREISTQLRNVQHKCTWASDSMFYRQPSAVVFLLMMWPVILQLTWFWIQKNIRK